MLELGQRVQRPDRAAAGEPGIGKSRLVQVLLERIAAGPTHASRLSMLTLSCSQRVPSIAARIQSAAHSVPRIAQSKGSKLQTLMAQAGEWQLTRSWLWQPYSRCRLAATTEIEPDPEQRKARIFATLLRHLKGLTAQRPVVGVFEDVHWSDPSTISLLDRRRVDPFPTDAARPCRPEFVSPWTGLGRSTPAC